MYIGFKLHDAELAWKEWSGNGGRFNQQREKPLAGIYI